MAPSMTGSHTSASHVATCCSSQTVSQKTMSTGFPILISMKVGAQILLLHASGKQLTAAPQTETGF